MPPNRKKKPRGARSRTCSENQPDDDSPNKKPRTRKNQEKGTIWVVDDTLDSPDSSDKAFLVVDADDDSDDSDYNPEEDEIDEHFVGELLKKFAARKRDVVLPPPIKLSKTEDAFYRNQSTESRNELHDLMTRVSGLVIDESEMPNKFRVLQLPVSDYVKSSVLKKINILNEADGEGDSHKLRSWVDAFMRVPFGKNIPLPIKLSDGTEKCTEFMINSRKCMDRHIYGMQSAKLQIMQTIAQCIVNPKTVGNVIALQGPMGVGKTSFARNAIAEVLQRPFEFFTLGGASDIANFVGHSYTYEGSLWGRIVDSLMHCKTMNPVMYFDELDKVSGTPQGEEIISMLIHLTDRSQNTQFHDRYFAGVDFDLSHCMFVFSFNDIDKVHPILRDRMNVIHCGGYTESDKMVILKDHILPEILTRLSFDATDITLTDGATKKLIEDYSSDEKGVRTLIRAIESMMTRINMLRITKHESMKEYKFYMDINIPLAITEEVVSKILCDYSKKEPETWRSLYT